MNVPLPTNDFPPPLADSYHTPTRAISWRAATFPTMHFYRQFAWNVYRSSVTARRGDYDDDQWSRSSHEVLRSLESVGVVFEVSGLNRIRNLQGPCVFIGNHMSMLETIVLPSIIRPLRDVTFVVKQSLMDYPVFRHILRSRDPIAVSRRNPREDFKVVMQQGVEKLRQGTSIVVFPQTTRSDDFDASQFNTIGVKLAARAKVPVVPIALRTDAWGNGKWIKDLGPIDRTKKVHFSFGDPLDIEGRGDRQQQSIIEFITAELTRWRAESKPVVSDRLGEAASCR